MRDFKNLEKISVWVRAAEVIFEIIAAAVVIGGGVLFLLILNEFLTIWR